MGGGWFPWKHRGCASTSGWFLLIRGEERQRRSSSSSSCIQTPGGTGGAGSAQRSSQVVVEVEEREAARSGLAAACSMEACWDGCVTTVAPCERPAPRGPRPVPQVSSPPCRLFQACCLWAVADAANVVVVVVAAAVQQCDCISVDAPIIRTSDSRGDHIRDLLL